MKEFIVTIEVDSSSATLAELSAAIGVDGSADSHSRGGRRGTGGAWDKSVWKLESGLPAGSSLLEHVDALYSRLPSEKLAVLARVTEDAMVYLNIGVLFDGVMCSIDLEPRHLQMLSRYGFAVSATTYLVGDLNSGQHANLVADQS